MEFDDAFALGAAVAKARKIMVGPARMRRRMVSDLGRMEQKEKWRRGRGGRSRRCDHPFV
jgi:hypothetical protein